jgi:hypothetical protein
MKYDDCSWHSGGDFPADLPDEAGATHIAMFVAWALLNGLASEFVLTDFSADLRTLQARDISPGAWFIQSCDGKFVDDLINDSGNGFVKLYYQDLSMKPGCYLADYQSAFPNLATLYHVPDAWGTYDRLEPVINARYLAWKRSRGIEA